MRCSQKNCGSTVQKALEAVPGVARAEVSFAAGCAWVWIPSPATKTITTAVSPTVASIVAAVENIGFGVALAPDLELTVEGMMCQKNCGKTVKNALEAVQGVARAEASFAEERARVWLVLGDGSGGGPNGGTAAAKPASKGVDRRLVGALESVGFDASIAPSVVLDVDGMMCQRNCGATVQTALEGVSGVTRVEVSFAERRARVWTRIAGVACDFTGDRDGGGAGGAVAVGVVPVSALVDAVETVGFETRVVRKGEGSDGASGQEGDGTSPIPAAVISDMALDKQKRVEIEMAGFSSTAASQGGGVEGPRRLSNGGDGGVGTDSRAVGMFSVSGMSCASCVGNVERFVMAMEGVEEVRVALLAEKVRTNVNIVCVCGCVVLQE